jgi:hypothetical protein
VNFQQLLLKAEFHGKWTPWCNNDNITWAADLADMYIHINSPLKSKHGDRKFVYFVHWCTQISFWHMGGTQCLMNDWSTVLSKWTRQYAKEFTNTMKAYSRNARIVYEQEIYPNHSRWLGSALLSEARTLREETAEVSLASLAAGRRVKKAAIFKCRSGALPWTPQSPELRGINFCYF